MRDSEFFDKKEAEERLHHRKHKIKREGAKKWKKRFEGEEKCPHFKGKHHRKHKGGVTINQHFHLSINIGDAVNAIGLVAGLLLFKRTLKKKKLQKDVQPEK